VPHTKKKRDNEGGVGQVTISGEKERKGKHKVLPGLKTGGIKEGKGTGGEFQRTGSGFVGAWKRADCYTSKRGEGMKSRKGGVEKGRALRYGGRAKLLERSTGNKKLKEGGNSRAAGDQKMN